jgi:hypothetical protein
MKDMSKLLACFPQEVEKVQRRKCVVNKSLELG